MCNSDFTTYGTEVNSIFITGNKLQDHILLEFKTLFTDSLIFMIVPFRMIAAE